MLSDLYQSHKWIKQSRSLEKESASTKGKSISRKSSPIIHSIQETLIEGIRAQRNHDLCFKTINNIQKRFKVRTIEGVPAIKMETFKEISVKFLPAQNSRFQHYI
jgi:hypothetical protein